MTRIPRTHGAAALALALVALSGCATRGYVKEKIAEANLHTDTQVAGMRGDLDGVRGDVDRVRTLAERLATGAIEYNEIGSHQVQFEFDDYRLSAEAHTVLDQLAAQLASHPKYVLEIRGYADARGSDRYNYRLGQERADETMRYLMTRHSVLPSRVAVATFGEESPVADNESSEGRSQNRRVQVRLLDIKASDTPVSMNPQP